MKRKLWIMLAVVLIAALWCGSAMAVERQVHGTVNLSTIPLGGSIILIDDTTLVIDEDKIIESITGNYALTIQGSGNLTIHADNTPINVKSLNSTFSGTLTVRPNCDETFSTHPDLQTGQFIFQDYAIYAAENITISNTAVIQGNHCFCIYSNNGDIRLPGYIRVEDSETNYFMQSKKDIKAHSGNIYLYGSIVAGLIEAEQGDIYSEGTVDSSNIRADNGNIYITEGLVRVVSEKTQTEGLLYAKNDITQSGGTLVVNGQTGIIAGRHISLAGNSEIRTDITDHAPGVAVRSENGNITLSGTKKVYGNNAIEAPKGSVTLHGNLEVGVVNTSGEYAIFAKNAIQSDCTSIIKNGPFYGLNGYYYVTQFLPGSGTGTMPPKMCWQGAEITLPGCLFDAPENCRFKCWSNAAHPSLNAGDTVVINGDTNFYAKWERIPRTVTFSPGSGSGTMASLTVGQGEQLTLPVCTFNPPSLPGTNYSFDRWKIGTSLYNPGSKVTITGNTTVTATWKSDTVLVEFLPNGGTGKMASPFLSKGDTYTLPENGFTPPAGKAFLYWNVSSYGKYLGPGAVITVMNDITVKPMWRNAVISFDPNGGTGTMAPVTMSDSMNGIYTFPACSFTPPANKTFNGWQIGNIIRMPGDTWTIYGDKVVKALWADKMYTVSFVATSGSSGTMSPVQVKSGSVYTFPACTFTPPSGKVFRGWLLSEKVYHQGETVTVTGNMQLYAEWQENPDNVYTLTFDGNGLTGSMPPISVKSGETVTLPECTFEVPATKRFLNWNLGTGSYMFPGAQIQINQNMTAKAHWEERAKYQVNFASVGGYQGELPETQTVYYGYPATEPEPLQREGYTFLGWFTRMTADEADRWDFSAPVTDYMTLYCGWQSLPPVAHPISITTNGHGTAIAYDAYEGGNEISEATKNTWVYVTVTPDPGYEQQYGGLHWTTASGQSGYASLNRFTMPDEAIAVTVTFRPVRIGFILPANLTTIEAEAFSGISAEAVVIPSSVTSITGNPFAGSSVTTIYGYPGSAAEAFTAQYPAYTFIPIDDEWMDGQ